MHRTVYGAYIPPLYLYPRGIMGRVCAVCGGYLDPLAECRVADARRGSVAYLHHYGCYSPRLTGACVRPSPRDG